MESDILESEAVVPNRPGAMGSVVIESQPLSALMIRAQVRAVGLRTDFQIPLAKRSSPGLFALMSQRRMG